MAQSLAACATAEQVAGGALSGRCALARRQLSASGLTHVMLGFEFAVGCKDVEGSVAVTALQHLTVCGGSAGGPGKGMPSQLDVRMLNKHDWLQNCTAFKLLYSDTSKFSVCASAESAHAEEAINVPTREMLVSRALRPAPAAPAASAHRPACAHRRW